MSDNRILVLRRTHRGALEYVTTVNRPWRRRAVRLFDVIATAIVLAALGLTVRGW
jgi:hypothetical protein